MFILFIVFVVDNWSISKKCTQHDIQTCVSFLITRMKRPDKDDWGKLKQVLRYLHGTHHMTLLVGWRIPCIMHYTATVSATQEQGFPSAKVPQLVFVRNIISTPKAPGIRILSVLIKPSPPFYTHNTSLKPKATLSNKIFYSKTTNQQCVTK